MPDKDANRTLKVASGQDFFQTYAFFRNSVLFLYVFLMPETKMNIIYRYILSTIAALLGILLTATAQSVRPESVYENMLLEAVSRYNSQDLDGAQKILNEIVAGDQNNDAAWYYLAMTYIGKGEIALAEEFFRKAVEIDGSNFWYRYRLARIYSLTGRPELAISLYEGILEDFPKKSELYLDLADLYITQREYDKALDTMNTIEKVFGLNESIIMFKYNILRTLGREEEAVKVLEDYNEEFSSAYVLTTLGDHELESYKDSTALAYYSEALAMIPDYGPALLGKAEVERITRRHDDYFVTLKSLMKADAVPVMGKTDYLTAVIRHSDMQFLRSFMPQMDDVVGTLVEKHGNDSTALQAAGAYYYTTARNDKAKAMFRENALVHPESLAAAATYVEFLMYAGDWKELSEEGRKAFERFPKETAFLEMASSGDFYLGDYQKVLDLCEKVIEVAPNDSSATLRAWSTIGDMHQDLGDYKKAYKAYEKALKINPDYVYVLNNYAYHLSMEGKKLKKAYAMSKNTIEAEPDNSTYLDTFAWILHLLGRTEEAKPYFKHAMLYGGKDSPVILDHYAEVLYALKEYDLAFVYWNLAKQKNVDEIPDLDEKVEKRREEVKK